MTSQGSSPKPKDDELICFCNGVLQGEIKQAIRDGSCTLLDIKAKTRASTGCGGCTSECERILAEMLAVLKRESVD